MYDGYIEQRNHDALIRLLNHIRSRNLPFKVALMVEPWMDIVTPTLEHVPAPGTARNLSADERQMILNYVWDNVYSVYPDLIFHWKGKPLLAAAGELYFDLEEDSPDDRFTLRSFRFKDEDHDPATLGIGSSQSLRPIFSRRIQSSSFLPAMTRGSWLPLIQTGGPMPGVGDTLGLFAMTLISSRTCTTWSGVRCTTIAIA